jgi:hypothetical protein
METWYEFPDMEGLKLCLCAAATHYYIQEHPLWLLVIGNPGSGKTEIVIQSLRTLPQARIIGSLTPKCFLSSFSRGKADTQEHSMLIAGGASQIWLAKDFTTFVSMRQEDKTTIASQLREIHDGELVSDTGVGGTKVWKGKVTMIAAATPGFERHWAALSDLGERFLTVRWRQGNRAGAMEKSRRQSGCEHAIRETAQGFMEEIVQGKRCSASMPTDDIMRRRDCIAEAVCQLRCHVERESGNRREVIEVSPPEFPTRVSMALSQVVRTHMDLFHREEPGVEEFALAERLAIDTIPAPVRTILGCIPAGTKESVNYATILRRSRLPESTLRRRLEDLVLTGVLRPLTAASWGDNLATFTTDFTELLTTSGLAFHSPGMVIEMPRLLKNRGHKASFCTEDNL